MRYESLGIIDAIKFNFVLYQRHLINSDFAPERLIGRSNLVVVVVVHSIK